MARRAMRNRKFIGYTLAPLERDYRSRLDRAIVLFCGKYEEENNLKSISAKVGPSLNPTCHPLSKITKEGCRSHSVSLASCNVSSLVTFRLG